MGEKPANYAVGICQRTGFKVKADSLAEEWTGLMVRGRSLDPKHPMLDFPAPRGEDVRDNATGPENEVDYGDTNPAPTLDQLGANN